MNLGQENEHQEFKSGTAQLDRGLKSLSAMLNRNYEGTVYFGVDDDGNVMGMEVGKKTLLEIRSRAAELISPRVILDITEHKDEDERSFIKVHASGTDIPYSCDGRYYIRTASADEQVGSDLLRKMLASGNTDLLSEISSVSQDLTFKGLVEYLNTKTLHASESKSFYSSFGLFNKEDRFNLMAYLLSDQNSMDIKVIRYAGTDKTVMDQRSSYSNQCLLVTSSQILDYFKLIDTPRKINLYSGIREETPLFDLQAFREAWINACVHNNWIERVPPAIYMFDDRLEIVSYGGIPYGLSEDGFYAGTSKPVNNRLFNIFITCNLAEQSGHGIPQIVKSYGKNAFSFRDGMLIVTIPFGYKPDYVVERQSVMYARESLTRRQLSVLNYLSENPQSTLQEVADKCSMSLSGVKAAVYKLKLMNLLDRKGSKKESTWYLS